MKRRILIFSLLLLLSFGVLAQKKPDPNPALTADSLATGNYKDVLNSFFQLTFDKLTGPDKELKFTSTPFAVMAKIDTSLLVTESYINYKTLRNTNFSFAVKLDSSYKFNGFSSGVKYALINKRDETVSGAFVDLVANNKSVQELFELNNQMGAYISKLVADPVKGQKTAIDYNEFLRGKKNFDELEATLQDTMLAIAGRNSNTQKIADTLSKNKKFNINKRASDIYEKMKKDFNNNLLWTIGLSDTTYKDQFFFSNIVLTTELLKGITNYKNNKNDVDLNIKATLQTIDDTLKTGRDLKRAVLGFEPGINIVLKTKETKKSFLEFKLSGGYYHTFTSLYKDEERDRITLNSTIRIRIMNDIWIPLDIKYDPKNGNFFGFLNVRANFKALGDIAKFLKN